MTPHKQLYIYINHSKDDNSPPLLPPTPNWLSIVLRQNYKKDVEVLKQSIIAIINLDQWKQPICWDIGFAHAQSAIIIGWTKTKDKKTCEKVNKSLPIKFLKNNIPGEPGFKVFVFGICTILVKFLEESKKSGEMDINVFRDYIKKCVEDVANEFFKGGSLLYTKILNKNKKT